MMASTAATTAALGCVASGQEVGRVRDLILGTFSLVWISVFFFFVFEGWFRFFLKNSFLGCWCCFKHRIQGFRDSGFQDCFFWVVFELLKWLKSFCLSAAAAAGLHHTKDVQWFESRYCFPWTEEDRRKCLRFHQGDLGRSVDFRFLQFCWFWIQAERMNEGTIKVVVVPAKRD